MDIKKNPNVNLLRYRTLFLLTGIVISLGAMLVAFELPTKELKIQDLTTGIDGKEIIELVPITQQEQPKPQVVQAVILSPVLLITEEPQVPNVSLFEFENLKGNTPILPYYDVEKETEVIETIPVDAVKEKPTFGENGTLDDFRRWINETLVYPNIAIETGTQGRVMMQFTVNHVGKVVNVKVLRSVDPLLDAEAERVIKMSPTWTPGKHNGQRVSVIYNIPVVFRLN